MIEVNHIVLRMALCLLNQHILGSKMSEVVSSKVEIRLKSIAGCNCTYNRSVTENGTLVFHNT